MQHTYYCTNADVSKTPQVEHSCKVGGTDTERTEDVHALHTASMNNLTLMLCHAL
jgi:hypothetical protein